MARGTGASLRLTLVAAVFAAAGCTGSGATPPIVYVTPGASITPQIVYVTPAPATGGTTTAAPGTAAPTVATPTAAPTSGPTAAPTPGAVPVVKSTTVSESGHASGCTNWTVTFHKPLISGVPAGDAMTNAVSTIVTNLINNFKSKLGEGIAAGPCFIEGNYDLGVVSASLLSIGLSSEIYLGGATTSNTQSSITFRVPTGATIALGDLFVVPAVAANILSTESRTRLAALLGASADVAWINSGTAPVMGNFDKAWVMTAAGLRLTFAELTVGPHVIGTPTITIPWAALAAVINALGPAGAFLS
jgi:hypothetical protein